MTDIPLTSKSRTDQEVVDLINAESILDVDISGNAASADHATTAGDADTVDGKHADELGGGSARNAFQATSTDTSTDINQTSWTTIPWDTEQMSDGGYTHSSSTNPGQVTFDSAGTYQVYVNLAYYSSTANIRESPSVSFFINGTKRDARSMGGYIRNGSGHNHASTSLMENITVNAGDTLTVQTYQRGNSGTVTLQASESTLAINQISEVVEVPDNKDNILLASGSGTNINGQNTVSWNNTDISDSAYSFDGSTVTFQESGTFEVNADADFGSSNARTNPNLSVFHNGSRVGVMGRSGYMRNASGHDNSSAHASAVLQVSSGDTMYIEGYQEAQSETISPARAQLLVKRLNR